jgi:uncharacterized protein (TIGR03435 family)
MPFAKLGYFSRHPSCIMKQGVARGLKINYMTTVAVAAFWAVAWPIVNGSPCVPQRGDLSQSDSQLVSTAKFDVASIKLNKSGTGLTKFRPSNNAGGDFHTNGASTLLLIYMAYGVDLPQIIGGPSWVRTEFYDIEAKADSSVEDELRRMSGDQARILKQHMLQALLADRFKLQVRHDTRELQIYNLVISKKGTKLEESKPQTSHGPSLLARPGELVAQQIPLSSLVGFLAARLKRPVQDQTGLKGKYDITLKWDPTQDSAEVLQDPAGPSIFTATQEQLGLKLVPTKGPVDFIIINHIERPSED